MSALDEIKKLEEQKQKLLTSAKKEALDTIDAALRQLRELGFHYELVSHEAAAPRTRRSGVRDAVLAEIRKHPTGISRTDLFTALNATDDKTKQSISNAVAALKRTNAITSDGGRYSPL